MQCLFSSRIRDAIECLDLLLSGEPVNPGMFKECGRELISMFRMYHRAEVLWPGCGFGTHPAVAATFQGIFEESDLSESECYSNLLATGMDIVDFQIGVTPFGHIHWFVYVLKSLYTHVSVFEDIERKVYTADPNKGL